MRRFCIVGAAMVLGILAVFALSLSTGSIPVGTGEIFGILTGKVNEGVEYRALWDIRLPRVIAGLILGGALAVAGFLLQTFFQNPIVGPFVLGISSGAKLAVALAMIIFLERGLYLSSLGMVTAAFLGAMASMGLVLLLSGKIKNSSMLVVCGIMIGYICSAITEFCVTFADDSNIVNLHNWSLGSLSGMSMEKVSQMTAPVLVTVLVAFSISKPIWALMMGEVYAGSMGVHIRLLRASMILLSSLLAAVATAFAGPVSFVGIAVPHLVKSLLRSSRPHFMIPVCFLAGGLITMACDLIARMAFSPSELGISSVTAVLLAPVVIFVMIRKRRDQKV